MNTTWTLPLINGAPTVGPYCPVWWVLNTLLSDTRARYGFQSAEAVAMCAATEAWWQVHMKPKPTI